MAQARTPIAGPADDGGHQGMHATPDEDMVLSKPEDRSRATIDGKGAPRGDRSVMLVVLMLVFGMIGVLGYCRVVTP